MKSIPSSNPLSDLLSQAMDNQFLTSETLEQHVDANSHVWRLVRVTVKQDCVDGLFPGQSGNFIICQAFGKLPLPESDRLMLFSCPLRFLDQARVLSEKWRNSVRAFHSAVTTSTFSLGHPDMKEGG